MNYYICRRCGTLYCGWARSIICQKCGGLLKAVSWEEFYSEKKEIIKGEVRNGVDFSASGGSGRSDRNNLLFV